MASAGALTCSDPQSESLGTAATQTGAAIHTVFNNSHPPGRHIIGPDDVHVLTGQDGQVPRWSGSVAVASAQRLPRRCDDPTTDPPAAVVATQSVVVRHTLNRTIPHDHQPASVSLVERKRRLVRERIIHAADELFSTQGFDNVSVSDIAARADVGRTTFFRYFGDKQEVVFAKEQEMLDAIARSAAQGSGGISRTASEAIEQLFPIVLELCEQATADPEAYARHFQLLDQHVELRARDALKMQQIADMLTEILTGRGTDESIAVFAAQVALACYQAAKRRADTPGALPAETRAAFELALTLGQ